METRPINSTDRASRASGEDLREVLRRDGSSLSCGMIWALVVAGLRVRLTRSLVTMAAVVLATAFLAYTGFTGKLQFNLAQRAEAYAMQAGDPGEDEQRLAVMLRRAGVSVDATMRGGGTDVWMLVMALLLCTVGIANAMLMSVTERFREIGTMKCLGAQDGLVVAVFLLESAFLGLAGGTAGALFGAVAALGGALLQFGGFGWHEFPFVGGLLPAGMALVAGVVLSVVGALYPAWLASRMNPVDALRIDE